MLKSQSDVLVEGAMDYGPGRLKLFSICFPDLEVVFGIASHFHGECYRD